MVQPLLGAAAAAVVAATTAAATGMLGVGVRGVVADRRRAGPVGEVGAARRFRQ